MARFDNSKKRPPNYHARSVKVRLLVLVFAVMVVLTVMYEAGKAKNWAWMWGGEVPTEQVDKTDYQVNNLTKSPAAVPTLPVGVVALDVDTTKFDEVADPYQRNLRTEWVKIWEKLSFAEQKLLYQVLRYDRGGAEVALRELDGISLINAKVVKHWDEFLSTARSSLQKSEQIPEAERVLWTSVLDRLDATWNSQKNALEALANDEELTSGQHQSLLDLQHTLDIISLTRVTDGIEPRSVKDQEAWYRLFEKLQNRPYDELSKESLGYVSYVELTGQPEAYRGKVLTVRGEAVEGYRVSAPENMLGVDHFNVIWVRPATGENAPLVIYTLTLPEGFPELVDRSEGATTLENEPLEITGYFFKRWVYNGRVGVRDAPLILASEPKWTPRPRLMPTRISPFYFFLGAIGCAVIAVALAFGAYRYGHYRTKSVAFSPEEVVDNLGKIDDSEVAPTVAEQLKQIAAEELSD